MIHILIGTKAQFIKMAPIMQRMQEERIPFNLIDLGQHSLITKDLREEFKIKEPDVYLSKGENISSLSMAALWLARIFFKSLSSRWISEQVFLNKKGVCLIHGDTASTLLGLYLAKRASIKIAHVEAGLRSFCWHEPFPEEILRVIVMISSDFLFAPSKWAFSNLTDMGLRERAILLTGNTGQEAALFSLSKSVDLGLGVDKFCLVTFHRMENIFSRKRLRFIIEIIKKASYGLPVVFVQHEPTINQLKKTGLWKELEEIKNIRYFKILSHAHFVHLLDKCSFLISDGGSIQEEAFYLGKPCLLLRRYSERDEGLGENVVLSKFDTGKINYFINHYSEFSREKVISKETFASRIILERLREYV